MNLEELQTKLEQDIKTWKQRNKVMSGTHKAHTCGYIQAMEEILKEIKPIEVQGEKQKSLF